MSEVHLKGAHNIENVLAAVCVARLAKVPAESIRTSVATLRLWNTGWSWCGKLNGVEFYNDSKATNVDATMKAVESFAKGIHLILGGKDKDSDYGLMSSC